MSKPLALLRLARSKSTTLAGLLHSALVVCRDLSMPMALAHAKNNTLAYHTMDDEVCVIGSTSAEASEAPYSFRDKALIMTFHVAVMLAFVFCGREIALYSATITDPVMDGWKQNVINAAYAVLFLGLAFGFFAFCAEKISNATRLASSLVSVAFITGSVVFLWVSVFGPHWAQIAEQIRLVIDIRSGQQYTPTLTPTYIP